MPHELDDDISTYIGHFRSEHAKLMALSDDLHKRILAVTMLSALAEGRYPSERRPGVQFVRLIEAYSAWSDCTSISVSSLVMAESRAPCLSANIMTEVVRRTAVWRARNESRLDPPAANIVPDNASTADRKRIDQFKHAELLWVYRNKLVHEYRKPGHGMDSPTAERPFYHGMTHLGDIRRETVELAYPVKWLIGLIPRVIDSLERHYLDSRTNPYDSYDYGSPWRH